MSTFSLPDLGEGLIEAEIVAWHVSVGDRVVADQPLVSVETDKAVVEIPAPHSGVVVATHGNPGDIVHVGEPLAEIQPRGAKHEYADTGAVVGRLETSHEKTAKTKSEPPIAQPMRKASRVLAVPAARALAGKLAVDLTKVEGSGPKGSITVEDIRRTHESQLPEGFERMHGARRAMAQRMADAGRQVVPATVTLESDVTHWWTPDADVLVRLLRALGSACKSEPSLNASFDGGRLARRLNEHVDVGVAVDLPDALLVPVIRGVEMKSEQALHAELNELVQRARLRSLRKDEMSGATITLSNFGAIGGIFASLVVTPPQVAIVGVGRVQERAKCQDGGYQTRRVLPLSLSFDHRAVTGGEAARFLSTVAQDLSLAD